MQDVAIEHPRPRAGRCSATWSWAPGGWSVPTSSNTLRPAFADEQLGVHTWVPRFEPRSTPRRYLFVRESDRTVLARAETIWVFVDLTTGRRRPIPPELLAAFDPVPEDDEVNRALGLAP